MKLLQIFFGLFLILLQAACAKQSAISSNKYPKDIKLITWNEDHVKPFKLTLFNQYRFIYSMTFYDAKQHYYQKSLTGKYAYNFDTVFLKFDKKDPSCNINHYLVREISGKYLIQNFTDGTPDMYFRLSDKSRHHAYKL